MMLEHRAELVGSGHAADSRAGYPLGILNIRGEIDRAEHDAGVRYAALRAIVYGSATPRSHLAMWQVILGSNSLFFDSARDDQEAKASTDLRAAVAYILIDGRRPLDVLTNVAVLDGGWERNAAEDEPKEFKMNEFGNLVAVACEAGCYLSRRDHQALKAALDRLVRLWRIPRERD